MNPSLLLIPDRYKAAKLYSQIPDSGAGDLTFARNSNATRVNSAGLIEKVRTNIALYSEQFNDAAWQKINATVSANSTTAPNGTLTADKLIDNAVNSPHYVLSTNTSTSNITTVSFFAKKAERNFALVFLNNTAATAAWFDLDSGTIGDKQAAVLSYSIVSAGNGWYRCTATFASISANDFCISVASANNVFSYVGDGVSGIFIWGAQLEAGDIATPYIPTTTAAVSVGITANIPRLDYTGGGCPSLLLEPQRTNLILFSEQIDNAAWTKTLLTAGANLAVSPDGYVNADKMQEIEGVGGNKQISQSISQTAGAKSYSVFVKKAERSEFLIVTNGGGLAADITGFDLITETVTQGSGSIVNYGNDWYRCTQFFTTTDNTSVTIRIRLLASGGSSYVGVGGFGLFVWGSQLEAGSYVSSYIPTLGSSVTRLADFAYKENIAGTLPTAYPFTLYAQGFLRESNDVLISINDYPVSDVYYQIGATASGFFANARNVTSSSVSTASGRNVGTHKVAAVFTSSEIRLFANGALIATGANTQTFNASANDLLLGQLRVNSDLGLRSSVNEALVFKSALTDAECIQLTA
jgi:hypothetical protein